LPGICARRPDASGSAKADLVPGLRRACGLLLAQRANPQTEWMEKCFKERGIVQTRDASRLLACLPVVMIKTALGSNQGGFHYVVYARPLDIDASSATLKIVGERAAEAGSARRSSFLPRETLQWLCRLASTVADKKRLVIAATYGMSGKQALGAFGIVCNNEKHLYVQERLAAIQRQSDEHSKAIGRAPAFSA